MDDFLDPSIIHLSDTVGEFENAGIVGDHDQGAILPRRLA